jgi:hypothetical protein
MARRDVFRQFLTNLDQPMPLSEKVRKLSGNLWRRVVLRRHVAGTLANRAAEWGVHRPVRMVITTLMMSIIITDTFWLLVCR